MRPNRLGVQVALCLACLIALNVLVGRVARSSIPRQVVRNIDQSPPITDLFVGNSLMAAGFEAGSFELANPGLRALNIGLGSSSPVEHDILLRRALRLGPKRVYYGIFDTQLFDRPNGGWGDLVGNRAMSYYVDLETAIGFLAPDDPIGAGLMRTIARFPLLVERYTIWARVEKVRRRLGEVGLPPVASSRFGRAEDFRLLESTEPAEFLRRCSAILKGREGLLAPVLDMIRRVRSGGGTCIVVEMPMTRAHRLRYYDHPEWVAQRQHAEGLVRREGGAYLVASDWIADDGFADQLHLNNAGAAEFSRKIARAGPPGPPRVDDAGPTDRPRPRPGRDPRSSTVEGWHR